MYALVSDKRAFVPEHFSALLTGIRFLLTVGLHVHFEGATSSEALLAELAGIIFLLFVGAHV